MTLAVTAALLLLSLSGCGESNAGAAGRGKERQAPLVEVEPATTMIFQNKIEAVGTALANEQVTISAPVTERLVRLGFDDGAFVRRGQVLAVLAQGEESASLSEAQARAREAEQHLNRLESLRAHGFVTQSSLDAQRAQAAQGRAQVAGAQASIGKRVITAPFAGYASLRNISAGAVVNSGSAIVTISDISTIKLDFTTPETVLAALRPGLPIEATSAAYPDTPFRGAISTIDPVIDAQSRAVTVRARLPNADGRLKPGMLMTVSVGTAPRQSLSVPELAVVGEGDQRFVFVADKGKAKRVPVKTGVRLNGRVEILSGLSPGQPVVTEGVVKVSDGTVVRIAGQPGSDQGAARKGGK